MFVYHSKTVPGYFKNWNNPKYEVSARSVSVRGSRIYSYDTMIGKIMTDKDTNKPILFLNDVRYSHTTSCLQRTLEREANTRGMRVIYVDESCLSKL